MHEELSEKIERAKEVKQKELEDDLARKERELAELTQHNTTCALN